MLKILSDAIKDINRLIKDLRGDNRTELRKILEKLDDLLNKAQFILNQLDL